MNSEAQATFFRRASQCLVSTVGVALLTWIISIARLDESPATVPIVYLLVVVLSALFCGRIAAVWASVCSFLAFNWFFVKPRYTLAVDEPTEWITLSMFLFTAIVVGQLMALLKVRAAEARQRQRETAALSDASWAIASQLDTSSALNEVLKQIAKVVEVDAAAIILMSDTNSELAAVYPPEKRADLAVITERSDSATSPAGLVMPIEDKSTVFGDLFLRLHKPGKLSAAQTSTVKSLSNHAAVILQRNEFMQIQSRASALADADRLKTALLSMVSHDFRSPLTSIKASVSTLLGDGSPLDLETQRGLLQGIELETDRLNRIVGNILDLSRLEAGAWRPKVEAIPVSELIGLVLEPFSYADNRRIKIKMDDRLPEISADLVQFVQVLKNLVENALKYSPEESDVFIETKLDDGFMVICVSDRGRGISQDEFPHLFKPFYRGYGLQESIIPGVGIGLAVCKGLVEAHGGILSAENREGGGAVFSIKLPLQESQNEDRSEAPCEY